MLISVEKLKHLSENSASTQICQDFRWNGVHNDHLSYSTTGMLQPYDIDMCYGLSGGASCKLLLYLYMLIQKINFYWNSWTAYVWICLLCLKIWYVLLMCINFISFCPSNIRFAVLFALALCFSMSLYDIEKHWQG